MIFKMIEKSLQILYNVPEGEDFMPSSIITKKIFADTLKNLMVSIPFAKISVGDITKECGMNRNSFYYHFQDKYELLNWIFLTEITREINTSEMSEISRWELLDLISEYFYKNNVFYKNALSYDGQNSFAEYLREFLKNLLEIRLEDVLEEDKDMEFKEFFLDFLLDAITSAIVRWIKSGAGRPPARFTKMMRKAITEGAMYVLLEDKP